LKRVNLERACEGKKPRGEKFEFKINESVVVYTFTVAMSIAVNGNAGISKKKPLKIDFPGLRCKVLLSNPWNHRGRHFLPSSDEGL
jgi:hypothetical protein